MFFKLSNLNSNLAVTLGYRNPALNNSARTNHYPADSVINFRNTYPLDSDLFGGKRYPTLEQPGPGH